MDDTLAQLSGVTVFSKLDANSGFWQVPLADKSRPLTMFITPFGRFHFIKLLFGISSAPEHFQKRMSKILDGLQGVVCQIDDVLVYGRNKQEHNKRLTDSLKRIETAGVTLNREKCSFSQSRIKFLGHVVDKEGVSADPERTTALIRMPATSNITEMRCFLSMTNG